MSEPKTFTTHLAMRPTPFTLWLRRFLPWQLLRFLIINLRMTVMIAKSHDTTIPARPGENDALRRDTEGRRAPS